MKNLFRLVFDLNKFSLLLLVLPYIIFNLKILFPSYFFSFSNLFLLLFIIILFDFIVKYILHNVKFDELFSLFFFIPVFIFFYGFYLTSFFQEYLEIFTGLFVRGRVIILVFVFFIIFFGLFLKNFIKYRYINFFLLIFCFVNFIFNFQSIAYYSSSNKVESNNYQKINIAKSSDKPVILLISDEYHSPDNLFQVLGDSSVYNFSNSLVEDDWIVNNSFHSSEISTIHSLSSLFNFNISLNEDFSNLDIFNTGASKLLKSMVYDSLISKNVQFINFGILRVGETKPLNELYFFPTNFVDLFLFNTIYFKLKHNTDNFVINGLGSSYFPLQNHNYFIINSLPKRLNERVVDKSFIYIHLYMPHSPFHYDNEFEYSLENDFIGYYDYWNFTNSKLKVLLSELTKDNKYRIILTGDHGLRGDVRFNSKKTFTAYFGFKKEDVESIKSVQDLGSLINACY